MISFASDFENSFERGSRSMPINEGNADPSYGRSCTSVRDRCVGERSSGTGRGLEEVEREI